MGDRRARAIRAGYGLVLALGAAANLWLNWRGKGQRWDLYPAAETLWLLCSVALPPACRSGRRLLALVVAFQLVDSFADSCAMGQAWWAGARPRRRRAADRARHARAGRHLADRAARRALLL